MKSLYEPACRSNVYFSFLQMAGECAGKFGGPRYNGVWKWSHGEQTQNVQFSCRVRMAQVSGSSDTIDIVQLQVSKQYGWTNTLLHISFLLKLQIWKLNIFPTKSFESSNKILWNYKFESWIYSQLSLLNPVTKFWMLLD